MSESSLDAISYPSSHGPYFHPLIGQNEFDISGTRSVRNKTHNIYAFRREVNPEKY